LILSAALIRRSTETTPPLTPVDLGNLRASWFVATPKGAIAVNEAGIPKTGAFKGPRKEKLASGHSATISEAQAIVSSYRKKFVIMIGYTANYALYVHEGPGGNMGARFQRPGAGVKWFEAAVKRNAQAIVKIIQDNAQVR
jgi:hypothetical protein